MSEPLALFPLVRELIHFDTLMEAAHTAIDAYSGQIWTDTAEHDPGITLLEALCYGVSDLSYRTSLPLVDLLTPSPDSGRDSIFPADFGPQRALTVGPITVDDYRKAMLDLYSGDSAGADGTGYFYFRDVQLVRESDDDIYTYWYDPPSHTYTFSKPDPQADNPPAELTVLGNYTLYLEPTRDGISHKDEANAALTQFLYDNRNLCEKVRKIVWLEAQIFWPKMIVELDDDVQEAAPIFAAIYEVTVDYINPGVERYTADELRARGMTAEEIYDGPQLLHGWIPALPPARDYSHEGVTLDLSGLASRILAIDGIKSITRLWGALATKPDGNWVFEFDPGHFPLPWGENPFAVFVQHDDVLLLKHGQRLIATEAEIKACLKTPEVITEKTVSLPAGQWRDAARYYPATDWIPPCYDLQDPDAPEHAVQLHRFLLPFEQELADGCEQLAKLPELLTFERTEETAMWPGQWPFEAGSVPDTIHRLYKQSLLLQLRSQQKDQDQELDILNYMLGYFGAQRAPRTLSTPIADFLSVQRGYLSELGDLGYHRANIRKDRISALQKRIAARLGIGPQLFGPSVDMGTLPFYLVENRSLLPVLPETLSSEMFAVSKVTVSGDALDVYTDVAHVQSGELVDLTLGEEAVLQTLTVRAVGTGSFRLSIADSVILQNNLDRIRAAAEAGTLTWHSSNVWMTTMVYQLAYASDQSGLAANQKRLASNTLSPFPVHMNVGDTIVINRGFGPLIDDSVAPLDDSSAITATVVSVDALSGTYVVTSDSTFPSAANVSRYRWYQPEAVTDRYSFTISLVFDRSLLDGATDPATTEQWMEQVVLSEIPADVGVRFYWFDTDQFRMFAAGYMRWIADGTLAGDYAYQLLFQLALGVKPQVELGIGLMKIASPEERLGVVGTSGAEWNTDAILADNLFYVPAESGARALKI